MNCQTAVKTVLKQQPITAANLYTTVCMYVHCSVCIVLHTKEKSGVKQENVYEFIYA